MLFDDLALQIASLAEEDPYYIPLLSNTSALLFDALHSVNWAGFYLLLNDHLVLGPFQGKPACIHIPVGKGVCGTSVKLSKTIRVSNVHDFEGHIACDSASNSEIVIPIFHDRKCIAVLDIDSTEFNRFSEEDQIGLEKIVHILESIIKWDLG